MLEPLTDLERGILEYLIEYLRRHTYQPSIREIGRRFDIKSTKTVSEYLQSLADKGWVERDPARSRGIRVLGLELDVDTISVPVYDASNHGTDPGATPTRRLNLDRRIVGGTRASFFPMPDDTLAHAGILEGDLLLVEPVAAADLQPGDVVVAHLVDEITVQRWDELASEILRESVPLASGRTGEAYASGTMALPGGRVTAIFRRLRVPAALVAAHDDTDADVHAHAT